MLESEVPLDVKRERLRDGPEQTVGIVGETNGSLTPGVESACASVGVSGDKRRCLALELDL